MNTNYLNIPTLKFFVLTLVLGLALFLFNACKKYSPSTPAFYIKASSVNVVTTASVQGSSSHKITELWLYLNGKYQGAYPIGSLMPIPSNGQNATIDVFAGIQNNGIKTTRITWLFYEKIRFDTLVENGKIAERAFTFKYDPGVKFEWVEDFDSNSGFSIINSSVSSTTFTTVSAPESFEGKSIKLQLTTNKTIAQIESALSYSLPQGSSNVYLELDYKCFQGFEIGLIAGTTQKPVFNLNASPNWNKIYINLADIVNSAPTSNTHKIYFKMVKANDSDDSRLYLDNIKVIHF